MPDVINHKNSDKLYSNIEIITMALYLLGGDSHYIDTEDKSVGRGVYTKV